MLKSIQAIEELQNNNLGVLKKEKWLCYLALTSERNINMERVGSLGDLKYNYVFSYVTKTLSLLSDYTLDENLKSIVEETLKWSEVAKAGMPHHRKLWREKGYNLYAHNVGSAEIYDIESNETDPSRKRIIHDLIATHGLIGQSIRGEVPLSENEPLYRLMEEDLLSASDLSKMLLCLNYCIVAAVNEDIWTSILKEAKLAIDLIVTNRFRQQIELRDKLKRLRCVSIGNGENFNELYEKWLSNERISKPVSDLLQHSELWYVEAALYDFSFEEFIKIFLMISCSAENKDIKHVSFEKLMKDLYYQHDGKKRVNIYKKRIIEKYLSSLSIDDILNGNYKENLHVTHDIYIDDHLRDIIFFNFRFSSAGIKLIEFCVEAEKSDVLYEKAVILLFDLFELRKDAYDRFYNEETYLQTMNQSIDYKSVLLDDIKGNRVIDIGPGGGALMDLIEDKYPQKSVMGIDISQNVLDSLKKKKQSENKKWDVLYGDALNLGKYLEKGSVDTIIFCSILHELYSYIEYEGKKFNLKTLETALKSAFQVLAPGGRILVRDGIMSEPEDQKRIIRFLSEDAMEFLKRYTADFKGRDITYKVVGHNEVLMPINDAMEFLYTYTWGEKSYVHEVNEQFGYFTPTHYQNFVTSVLGDSAKILKFKHFLQDGYTIALSQKIEFFDEERNPVRLPDSTCIMVIEKLN